MRSYQSPPLYSFVIDQLSVEIEDDFDENNNDLSLNSVKSGISEQNIQEIMSLTNALNDTENNSYQPNISIIDSYSISQEDFENIQGMSCEGACAHAHVRCAVAHVRVRAKSILKSVRDVRACGSFLGVRCAITFCTLFG